VKIKPILLLIATVLISCAKQGFPPGGPEDRTPPEIVRTQPLQGQTLVPTGREVDIWFSKGVRPSALSDAVFFSPHPGEGVVFKWSGRRLRIRFPKPFPDSTTVVVTLGTGIQDYRGNAMKSTFTLAFSTGPVLDQGRIRGKVHGTGSALGLDVWAYVLRTGSVPDPRRTEPDYAVQCQATGEFAFSHLSPGGYRIYAVRDRLRDRLYQPDEDEIGVPFRDVVLSPADQYADSISFRMTREDTLGPSLVRAAAPDRERMVLLYSESIVLRDPWYGMLRIEGSDSGLFKTAYVDPSNPRQLCILTRAQQPNKKYVLFIRGLKDSADNPPDTSTQKIQLEGSGRPDTTLPRLTAIQPKPGDLSVDVAGALRLVFDEPMDSTGSRSGIVLSDSAGRPLECKFRWDTPASVDLTPKASMQSRHRYTLAVRNPLADAFGHAVMDTVIRFRTLNTDTLSEISGTLGDWKAVSAGTLVVSIRQTEGPDRVYRQTLPKPGPYRFKGILPGRYLLECYRDRDGNGQYSNGNVFPYQPSEQFAVYPDTIAVRSRWPNEGNNLVLP